MRKVFLDDLPRGGATGTGVSQINWNKSIRYKVRFIYDDIEGEVTIIDYKDKYLSVKYLDNEDFKINAGAFAKCYIGSLLKVYTSDFKYTIGQVLKSEKRDITIIDRKHKPEDRKDGSIIKNKYYKFKCNKCGFASNNFYNPQSKKYEEEFWVLEGNLLNRQSGCPCCSNRLILEGVNDIPTTTPWMVKYFQGGYDEAKLYTKGSAEKIIPICPNCGRVSGNKVVINKIFIRHSISCSCSDKICYPEKMMFIMLEQLGIAFATQLTKTTFKWCKEYRYDFYIPSLNIIIETHGMQHYKESKGTWKRDLKEVQENDRLKKELAIKNGIKEENYIIIDCRKSELEFIKQSIINSALSKIFDLNIVDWTKVEEFVLSSRVKEACNYWNSGIHSTKEIAEIMKVCYPTICKWLKVGQPLGWCDYDPKKSNIAKGKLVGKSLICLENGFMFESASDCARQSEELFGIKLGECGISAVCRGTFKKYKGFTFEYHTYSK